MYHNFIITFGICKSTRSNAQHKYVDLLHFENSPRDHRDKTDDLMKIHHALENIMVAAEDLQHTNTPEYIIAASINFNSNNFGSENRRHIAIPPQKFKCIGDVVNWLYDLYIMMDSGNTLTIKEMHNYPPIRQLVENRAMGNPVSFDRKAVRP